MATIPPPGGAPAADVNELFRRLDENNDGVITHEDIDRLEVAHAIPFNVAQGLRASLGPRPAGSFPRSASSSSLPPSAAASSLPRSASFPPRASTFSTVPSTAPQMQPVLAPSATSTPRTFTPQPLVAPAVMAPGTAPVLVGAPPPGGAAAMVAVSAGPPQPATFVGNFPSVAQVALPASAPQMPMQAAPQIVPGPTPMHAIPQPVPPRFVPAAMPAATSAQPPVPVAVEAVTVNTVPEPTLDSAPAKPPPAKVEALQQSSSTKFYRLSSAGLEVPVETVTAPVDAQQRLTPGEIFTIIDRDGDGYVSKQELMKWVEEYRAQLVVVDSAEVGKTEQEAVYVEGIDPSYEELFIYRDLDGELTGSGGEVFAQIDSNCDGVITREEFMQAFSGHRRLAVRDGQDVDESRMPGWGGDEEYAGELEWGGGDFDIAAQDMEFGAPNANMERPSIHGHGPNFDLYGPNVHLHGPNVNLHGPNVNLHGPNVDLHGPSVHFHGPNFDAHGPKVHLHGPSGDFYAPGVKFDGGFHMDAPKVMIEPGVMNCWNCCTCTATPGDLDCCSRCLFGCESCTDRCETLCFIPCLYQFAACCGLNIKAEESLAQRLFPWLFTLLCFILFATPISMTYQMSKDMQVQYWISDQLHYVLVLPLLYLGIQWWQAAKCKIVRSLIILSLIGSCVLLFFIGDMVLLSSHQVENSLQANDCTTNLDKAKIQIQWQNAQLFYTDCIKQTAVATATSLEAAYGLYRIQDCAGYAEQLSSNPAWPYLGALEEKYNCGGWCTRSQPLWTFKPVKDSCAISVAGVLENKVQPGMTQMLAHTVLVCAFASIALIQVGPILRSHGLQW